MMYFLLMEGKSHCEELKKLFLYGKEDYEKLIHESLSEKFNLDEFLNLSKEEMIKVLNCDKCNCVKCNFFEDTNFCTKITEHAYQNKFNDNFIEIFRKN